MRGCLWTGGPSFFARRGHPLPVLDCALASGAPAAPPDDALRAAVVAPALALLAGKPVAEALPAATPGLLRYGSVQDANGDTDLRVR